MPRTPRNPYQRGVLALGPYTGIETKAVSFRIDVRDLVALDALVADAGVNRGQILRSLVKSELRRHGRLPAGGRGPIA